MWIDTLIDLTRGYARMFRWWSAIGFWATILLSMLCGRALSLSDLLTMGMLVALSALVNLIIDRLVARMVKAKGKESR